MIPPPVPPHEEERLHALHSLHLLDTPPESQFDELVELAAKICDAPISIVSLIDRDRQWFKACRGLGLNETPRDISFCGHTIAEPGELLVVSDATRDARFADNPLVTGETAIRFYAGVPLHTASGHALGAFCVMDRQPRELTADQAQALRVLARQAAREFDLRHTLRNARESEERYRLLLNRNPIPLFVFDCETLRYLTVNDAAVARYGYSREEFLRMTVLDLRRPEDRPQLLAAINQKIQGLESVGRWPHVRKDGTILTVDIFAHDLTFRGRAARIVLAVDVSEHARVTAELAASEARFRALSDSAPIGIFESTVDGHSTYANASLVEILGRSAEEVMRFGWVRTIHPDDRAAVRDGWRHAALTGQRWRGDVRLVRPDGSVRWAHGMAAPSKDAQGRVIGFVGTVEDITEQRLADLALVESEKRFKVVARAVSDVVWDFDLERGTIWCSDGVQALFGHSPADISTEHDWGQLVHPDDRARVLGSLQDVIATGGHDWEAEYRLRRKDGSYAHVLDRGHVMRDDAGRPVRMIGGLSDHTERKTLETQLLRAQRMESIGTLAGGIAHDLNNVLTPIVLSLELLQQQTTTPHQRALVKTLQSSAQRGADLVRQVLTFARGVDGQRVALNVGQAIDELARIVRETFPRHLRLTFENPAGLWPVIGDATHIHQVLLNLVLNARDAMATIGTLSVVADNVILDRARAGLALAASPGPYVRIRVSDTGTGIAPEVRDRIFEPFFTTKPPGKGTGLGLATVHAVVKSHRGFVDVESEPGRGTTFSIYLPAETVGSTVARAEAPSPLPRGRGELILLVDDEDAIRLVAERTLATYNYRVLVASNGAEACRVFEQHHARLALVVTDMMMPVMDGAALIAAIRSRKPAFPVIAASGLHDREDVARTLSVSPHQFLPKPFTAESLLHLVRNVLDRAVPVSTV